MFISCIIIGTGIGHTIGLNQGFVRGVDAAPPVTTYVTVTEEGHLAVKDLYETLLVECKAVPWQNPADREKCDVMSMLAVANLLVYGSVEEVIKNTQ